MCLSYLKIDNLAAVWNKSMNHDSAGSINLEFLDLRSEMSRIQGFVSDRGQSSKIFPARMVHESLLLQHSLSQCSQSEP
jgi:hypothetical protein